MEVRRGGALNSEGWTSMCRRAYLLADMREGYTLFMCTTCSISCIGEFNYLDEPGFIEGSDVIPLCLRMRVRQCVDLPQWPGKAASAAPPPPSKNMLTVKQIELELELMCQKFAAARRKKEEEERVAAEEARRVKEAAERKAKEEAEAMCKQHELAVVTTAEACAACRSSMTDSGEEGRAACSEW
jgi:hypothetical protein